MTHEENNEIKNLDANVSAAISYLVPPFTGILFFALEKEDKFVKFHAFQSILFGIVSMGALSVAGSLEFIFIGYMLRSLLSLAIFVGWVWLMWKAYNKEKYELPYLGKIAKDQIYKK